MESLIQTIAILAASVVFLSKVAADLYAKRKNGSTGLCSADRMCDKVEDLHGWHKPVADPKTGQPRFMWYENSLALKEELVRNREAMAELKTTMEKMNEVIEKMGESIGLLAEQIRNCPVKEK